jgi:hypothetical protein
VADGLITSDELRRIAEEKEMAQLREALEQKRKADEERHHLHDAFMAEELVPDVFERASRMVKGAAERGEREVLAIRFPSEYCTDGGRAINNFEPNWPETLTGFAKRAHEFFSRSSSRRGTRCALRSWISPAGCRATSGSSCAGELRAGRADRDAQTENASSIASGPSGSDRPPGRHPVRTARIVAVLRVPK